MHQPNEHYPEVGMVLSMVRRVEWYYHTLLLCHNIVYLLLAGIYNIEGILKLMDLAGINFSGMAYS